MANNRGSGVLETSLVGSTSTTGYDGAVFFNGDPKSGMKVVRFIRLVHRSWDSFLLPIFAKWFPSTRSIGSLFSCK